MTEVAPESEEWQGWRRLYRKNVTIVAILLCAGIAVCSLPVLLFIFVLRPQTVLVEQHYDPDFTLIVMEGQFLGRTHAIHTGSRWLFWRRREVANVFPGTIIDTPPIASASLAFEWHDDRGLVALRGADCCTADNPSLYLALLGFDHEGRVWEVPHGVDPSTVGGGDHWGRFVRARIHDAIEQILDEESQSRSDTPSSDHESAHGSLHPGDE